jgi:hypothetical protein
MGGLGLVCFVLFGVASVAFYRINDRIVSDICRRERRPHPGVWTLSLYWQWRTSVTGWYSDAKRAGLLTPKMLASAAVVISFAGLVVAGVLAGGHG